jgi:hypothetical protein
MATFGSSNITGVSYWTAGKNAMFGSPYTLTENGNLSKLTAYVRGLNIADQECKGVVYAMDGSGPKPYTLMGYTNEITVAQNQGAGWVDLTFAAPLSLTAASYMLGLHLDGVSACVSWGRVDGTGPVSWYVYDTVTYTSGPPATWASPNATGARSSCIYATYTKAVVLAANENAYRRRTA